MVNHQLEEGVHQQNAISKDAAAVQKNRLKNQKTNNTGWVQAELHNILLYNTAWMNL